MYTLKKINMFHVPMERTQNLQLKSLSHEKGLLITNFQNYSIKSFCLRVPKTTTEIRESVAFASFYMRYQKEILFVTDGLEAFEVQIVTVYVQILKWNVKSKTDIYKYIYI